MRPNDEAVKLSKEFKAVLLFLDLEINNRGMFCGSGMSVDNIVGGGVALFLCFWQYAVAEKQIRETKNDSNTCNRSKQM